MGTKYISSVKLDGSVYNIKDTEARNILNNLFLEEIILDGGTAPSDDNLIGVILDGGTAPID